jgi:hypothetical protein
MSSVVFFRAVNVDGHQKFSTLARLRFAVDLTTLCCMNTPLDSSPILQTAFAFWNSKVLLTAVEMGLFTKLGNRHLTGAELGRVLGLHPRGIKDFFDALVAMKFLGRDGDGPPARYFNTPEGAMYLDENIIDDARRQNVFGLLMSLNMLIEFGDAFDFSGADFREWRSQVGFKRFDLIHLAGPCSAAVAYK